MDTIKEELNKQFGREGFKMKKNLIWQIATFVFAALFVVSMVTHGFSGITGGTTAVTGLKATILNDNRCTECDTTQIVARLEQLFPGIEITNLDYGDAEGKALYDNLAVQYLPAVLFNDAIESTDMYGQLQPYLEPAGEYLSLRIGANFDPAAEICDNKVDDDGDKLVDCRDDGCKESTECRQSIAKKLDLFVMSQCPYGVLALNAMKEVLENFKGSIDFDIHYIAADSGDGTFSSLHGQPEVDEDIRELCAIKYYPANYKYMDYIWCRNKDISSTDWQSCANEEGMDAAKIKTCSEGDEGKELLSENIKLTNELSIGASPTWLTNNKYQFSGVDSETVKQNYCQYNTALAGCSNTLSTNSETPSGGCGG